MSGFRIYANPTDCKIGERIRTWPFPENDIDYADCYAVFSYSIYHDYGVLTENIGTIYGPPSDWPAELLWEWDILSFQIPENYANYFKNSNTFTVTITAKVYDSAGSFRDTATASVNVSIDLPPEMEISISDPTGNKDSFGSYLQSLSKFSISSYLNTKYGATIVSYNLSITGMGGFTSYQFTTDVIPVFGKVEIKAKATDSRGNKCEVREIVEVTAYMPPRITDISAGRSNAAGEYQQDGTFGKIVFSAEVSPVGGKNTSSFAYCYRIKGSEEWSETELQNIRNQMTVTEQVCIFPASTDYSYEVAIRITDQFTGMQSTIIPISSAFLTAQVTADGTGISFGCPATKNDTVEFGIAAMFDADVTGSALGLAGLPIIPAGSDFNYYTSPGGYSGANANFVNCPSSAAGVLIVSYAIGFLSPSALSIRQVYLPADNSAIYIRILTQTNGSWTYGEWKKITLAAIAVG